MMKWIKLSLRNILRNKRRSLFTIVTIGIGFASIGLYYGYLHHTYWALSYLTIHGEGLGHLRINKAGWKKYSKTDKVKYMFTYEETQKIMKVVGEEKDVILSTPQVQLAGLVSNGEVSTLFIGQGVVPKDDKILQTQRWIKYSKIKGKTLTEDDPSGVEMSKGLSKYLHLTPGTKGVVMSTTVDGQMKALDIKINGVYDAGNEISNNKFLRFNLNFAQSLLDTQSTERIVVLLKDVTETETMRKLLLKKLGAAGINCEILTWNELSMVYSKVKSFLDAIFIFLFGVVLFIAVLSIINTMSMVVLERTREIGTLRTLGLKRKGVAIIFALEGTFLGLFGCIAGFVLHILVLGITRYHPIRYSPPGASSSVLLYIDMVPDLLLMLFISFILISMASSVISARRAAYQNIVDALGHT
jgi:putative ABC transport system permease protein